ncbi:unnamed protein product [Bursaphelenchus okinawaensis]|uniref:V-type proton ATPase subunit S1/VOA1 transmembrane domain-containing protein n=1 Tax=Bursaphelenchus okinawaensis TaxID=465554 RepID=A0A811KXN9_9BILA|nr:unnamed protein product [Bursaphelenchus okinawaensis]CAG9113518.1 unnamed protein product [Bursaphelenchus okinawaensis]
MMLRLLSVLSVLVFVNCVDNLNFPLVLPPFGEGADVKKPESSWGTCLLYLESVNVIVYKKQDGKAYVASINSTKDAGHTYKFETKYVNCSNASEVSSNLFILYINTKSSVPAIENGETQFTVDGPIVLKLNFTTNKRGAVWGLTSVKLDNDLVIKKSGNFLDKDITVKNGQEIMEKSIKKMAVGGYFDYNYACSNTKFGVFANASDNFQVGISFGNLQVQNEGYAVDKDEDYPHFSHNVNDCVGTFSAGSWMGILVSLLLATVLIFGFLMLNSVQTTDRFDDPKQKQLIINFKD